MSRNGILLRDHPGTRPRSFREIAPKVSSSVVHYGGGGAPTTIPMHSVHATEMQSMRENDFECLASTGVKSPVKAKVAKLGHLLGDASRDPA